MMAIEWCQQDHVLTDAMRELRDWLLARIAEDRPRQASVSISASASDLLAAHKADDQERASKEAKAVLSRWRYGTWRQEVCQQLLALEAGTDRGEPTRRILDLTRANFTANVEGIRQAIASNDYEAARSLLEIRPSDELPVRCQAALAAPKPGS